MNFQRANEQDFPVIQNFYWNVAESIHKNNVNSENLGWEKGIYPSDEFLLKSLANGELYTLTESGSLYACVVLNGEWNDGYNGCPWSVECAPEEVLVPHALAVAPALQGMGIGKAVVKNILEFAKAEKKKAVRLDVLGACKAAERLYTACGFQFIEAKNMFYEDTGWTEYKMFEFKL